MKEKISMNQEIKVILLEKNEVDYLCFEFDKDVVEVNLNDVSGQQDLKTVFSKLLKLINDKDVELKLEIADGYKKGLYKEVCYEYVDDLNNEIKEVREEMKKL